MKQSKHPKIFSIILIIYFVLVVGFYFIAGEQLHFKDSSSEMFTPSMPTGEITSESLVTQRLVSEGDELLGLSLYLSTYGRENSSSLSVTLTDGNGAVLAVEKIEASGLTDNAACRINFSEPIETAPGQVLYIHLRSQNAAGGNAVTAWWGNAVSTARVEMQQDIAEEDMVTVNGQTMNGMLCVSLHQRSYLLAGEYYWHAAAAIALVLIAYLLYLSHALSAGKSDPVLRLASAFKRYGFLLKQLIVRDFKTKYKRSVLGVFWSFLNPLLTMLVQYVVFSTIFKTDIPNFALYLLTGIVCFNFFNEASTMSLMSIVGNATLITKVYVPKYIYPVSRVLSSTVNLLLAMIPLLAVMLITGTPLRPAVLLLPFGIVCLVALCIGMGFILSTLMVFFRDTQFLWGVLSMLWMYATPIFYPESIIPAKLMLLYKCNPLYHIIRFMRIILIDGVSPEPKAYLLCLVACLVPLAIGAIIFKKFQDRFVLNL